MFLFFFAGKADENLSFTSFTSFTSFISFTWFSLVFIGFPWFPWFPNIFIVSFGDRDARPGRGRAAVAAALGALKNLDGKCKEYSYEK